jgi:hypothetical protein
MMHRHRRVGGRIVLQKSSGGKQDAGGRWLDTRLAPCWLEVLCDSTTTCMQLTRRTGHSVL